MSSGKDYLPQKEAELVDWIDNFVSQVTANAAAWGIPLAEITGIQGLQTEFKVLHTECAGPNRTQTLVATKDAKKAELTAAVRGMVNYRFSAPVITDAIRVQCGLHPRDHTRTSHGVPQSRPDFDLRDRDFRRLDVDFWDQGSERKAKPLGINGAVISWAVLDAPPAVQGALAKSVLATHTPYTLEFVEEERGKTAYVALQWQNGKGQKGPFSEILSAIVP
jgi:hypothetical protein